MHSAAHETRLLQQVRTRCKRVDVCELLPAEEMVESGGSGGSGGSVVAPMVGALGLPPPRSVFLRRLTALRMQAKAATMTSAACALSREHACRTKAARGICGTAVLHAAALARRMIRQGKWVHTRIRCGCG
jgi:hypothetical protein